MGDSEKKEEIIYTPEELNEIRRIVDLAEVFSDAPSITHQPLRPVEPPKIDAEKIKKRQEAAFNLSSEEGGIDDNLLSGLTAFDDSMPPFNADGTQPDVFDTFTYRKEEEGLGEEPEINQISDESEDESSQVSQKKRISTLEQLDELTKTEPESLDQEEIETKGYADNEEAEEESEADGSISEDESIAEVEEPETLDFGSSLDEIPTADDASVGDESVDDLPAWDALETADIHDLTDGDGDEVPDNLDQLGNIESRDFPEADDDGMFSSSNDEELSQFPEDDLSGSFDEMDDDSSEFSDIDSLGADSLPEELPMADEDFGDDTVVEDLPDEFLKVNENFGDDAVVEDLPDDFLKVNDNFGDDTVVEDLPDELSEIDEDFNNIEPDYMPEEFPITNEDFGNDIEIDALPEEFPGVSEELGSVDDLNFNIEEIQNGMDAPPPIPIDDGFESDYDDSDNSLLEQLDNIDDLDFDPENLPSYATGKTDKAKTAGDPFDNIEPLDDNDFKPKPQAMGNNGVRETGTEINLSDRELKKLKRAILLFDTGLRNAITDVVINDKLSPIDTRALIDMILRGQPETKIREFLSIYLGTEIPETESTTGPGRRRVIHSRPEYMKEGRQRQQRRLKLLAYAGVAAVLAFIITILSYQYIYKPVMAKKKINEGIVLIVRGGDYVTKPEDYRAAEELAKYVDENYVKDYIYGYNCYAAAYLQIKEYQRAYSKLNDAYKIAPQNVDTLLNLGYFYARVPAAFYNNVKSSIHENYYPSEDMKERNLSQLDLSINFYKRVLAVEPKEVRALQGIGNAYYLQQQYLKAKNFYADILKVDPDSVVGYSGLLNLYIERDTYELVATLHTDMRYKKLDKKLPKALLAKLAGYYLSKNKTDSFNVRVDHGVQSPRLRNENDSTIPAVNGVLSVLNSIDNDYPPLLLLRAKVALYENNIKAAERYLDNTINLAPGYFDALHMRGKLYYETSQPVRAYELLNRAASNYVDLSASEAIGGMCECEGLNDYYYKNQPDFIHDDFYKGTERIGETHALLGNIFYYFFDRVRYRYGDLEDEMLDEELEKMVNYNIAREKYELALSTNFSTSEIRYNLGRIHYLNKQYEKSLEQWLHLYDDFITSPELMLALGNAFYHLGQYDTAKGEFLKLINVLEHEADGITIADRGNKNQVKLFKSLATAYNNIGSVYQLKDDESKSSLSYWKAIENAKRIDLENEFARVNLARSFGRGNRTEPILDESVPYSIKFYSDDMRWARRESEE